MVDTRAPSHPVPKPSGAAARWPAPASLRQAVAKMAAEDPQRAQLFLLMLRQPMQTGRPRTVQRVCRTFGIFGTLGATIAEAARPTRLMARPASLATSWATVGRLLASGMLKVGEEHDTHAG